MKAYVLAGGLGSRLFPLTLTVPKPLLMLGQKTVLEHVLDRLITANFEEIVIAVSLRSWMYRATIGEKYKGVKVRYVESDLPLGTAGQLRHAAEGETGTFFVSYSDSIIDADFISAINYHIENKALGTIFVMGLESKVPYGQIVVKKNKVVNWREKPTISTTVAVGAFIFEPKFLSYIPRGQKYGMNVAINGALSAGENIIAYNVKSFTDVGNMKSYIKAVKDQVKLLGEIP